MPHPVEYLAQKMQELTQKTLQNYLLKSTLVCVCVCSHSFPMIMVTKECSYTFTPAFPFMACTATALTSSSLGYRNLNCRSVPTEWVNCCTAPWIFCCFSVNISLFGWLFHECLHNWNKFQVPYNTFLISWYYPTSSHGIYSLCTWAARDK